MIVIEQGSFLKTQNQKKEIITLLNDIIIEKQGQETLLFMLLINANIH